MDGYIGGQKKGVQDICQCLVLDLNVLRGGPVEVGGGEEESWNGEGRSQEISCL